MHAPGHCRPVIIRQRLIVSQIGRADLRAHIHVQRVAQQHNIRLFDLVTGVPDVLRVDAECVVEWDEQRVSNRVPHGIGRARLGGLGGQRREQQRRFAHVVGVDAVVTRRVLVRRNHVVDVRDALVVHADTRDQELRHRRREGEAITNKERRVARAAAVQLCGRDDVAADVLLELTSVSPCRAGLQPRSCALPRKHGTSVRRVVRQGLQLCLRDPLNTVGEERPTDIGEQTEQGWVHPRLRIPE
mmetsp:Transcript_3134/g.6733  ORF Transcript_3134/g.6733 Transcript_3134/m.6733 type:complete len:244 (-) Transcript_3134:3-734(-)